MVRDWLELVSQPHQSVLDSNPDAKAKQREWLHRRLITAAGARALKMTKLLLLPEKYKTDVNQVLIKYHATPFIQRCSARACRSRTLVDRIAQRGYTSWEPRLCQWIDIILYSIIIASSSCRDSRYVGSPRKIVFSVEGSKPYISYTVRSEI